MHTLVIAVFAASEAITAASAFGLARRAFQQDVLVYETRMSECKKARPRDVKLFDGRLAQFKEIVAEAIPLAEKRLSELNISESTWAAYESAAKAQLVNMLESRKGMGDSLFMFTCVYVEENNPLPTPQRVADNKVQQFEKYKADSKDKVRTEQEAQNGAR